MKLIDTHSHVIPYWDDGAPNWQSSLDMLRQAHEDGISQLFCTSHFMSKVDIERENEIWPLYQELVERVKADDNPITLHMGSELYLTPELELNKRICTIAQNQRYFLVEFPMAIIPEYAPQMFFDFIMDEKIPLLAHPERNGGFLEKPDRALEFVERGALLQVTASSLLGNFGTRIRQMAFQLMDANLVHVVATDAHNLTSRPLVLSSAYRVVAENWGMERADLLFYENPQKLINGENISIGEPKPTQGETKKGLKSIIKSMMNKI